VFIPENIDLTYNKLQTTRQLTMFLFFSMFFFWNNNFVLLTWIFWSVMIFETLEFAFWGCFDFYSLLLNFNPMACYISNIKVKKHIQSIKDSHERGNIGENPGILRKSNRLRP